MAAGGSEIILSIRDVSKSFPGVKALDGVSIDFRRGTVHGIVGENGAGKSTLMKIIYGAVEPDEGEMVWDGRQVEIRNPQEARALIAMQSMPYVLVTRNPAVKTIADFTDKDKIALPAVKLTGHAIALEMEAAKIWGKDHYDKLDSITVTRSHADAAAAVMSGQSEINSHFASAPYYYYELATPGIHQVVKSYDTLGAKHTNGVLVTTRKFHDANLRICGVVVAAFEEADAFIKAHPREAAQIYLTATKDKNALDALEKMVADPDVDYTTTPVGVMKIVDFMYEVGRIRKRPASWKEMFFPEAYGLNGS